MCVILMSAFVFKIFQMMSGSGVQASNIQDDGNINRDDGVVCAYTYSPGSEYKQKLPGTPSDRPRTRFGGGVCATWAYPSVGGVVYGHFTAVQLKQLGLSNMEEANRSDNQDDEDPLSVAMLQQGAHWWPSWGFYLRHSERMENTPYDFHFPPNIYVAYPSSGKGVWVLKCSPDWRQEHDDDITKPSLPNVPGGVGRPEEPRADGGRGMRGPQALWRDSPGECEDIPKTLDEGVQRGKRYEALLKRMEDMHYEDAWLEHGSTEWPVKKA
ncbi:hypothetical protein PG987_007300 [Apiospora arundinis]